MDYTNDNSTNVSSNCIKFDTRIFHAVAIVRAVSGFVSVLASLLVILLIIVFKKYLFFTQRLILYLSIASMLNGLTIATQGANYFPDNEYSETYCSISAFLEQTTHWSLLLAVASIAVNVYLMIVHEYEGRRGFIFGITTFIVPILFNWIPFIHGAYGMAGPWCWFSAHCQTNKQGHGRIYQYVLWYIPLYSVLLGIIIIYVIVYYSIKKHQKQYKGIFNPDMDMKRKQQKKEVLFLMYYPLIFLLLQIPPTANRIADAVTSDTETNNYILVLWFLHALLSPLTGGLVCVAYALDPETRIKLRKTSLKTIISYSKFNDSISEYPITKGHSDSITDSGNKYYNKYSSIHD